MGKEAGLQPFAQSLEADAQDGCRFGCGIQLGRKTGGLISTAHVLLLVARVKQKSPAFRIASETPGSSCQDELAGGSHLIEQNHGASKLCM